MLQPTGLAVLEELGLLSAIYSLGKRIDRMVGTTMPAAKRVLDVHYESLGEDMHGLAVHRAALFDVLFAAVKRAEISIQTSVDAASIRLTSSDVLLEDRSQREWGPFDLIVDASGSNSSLHGFAALPLRKKSLQYGAIWGAFGWLQERRGKEEFEGAPNWGNWVPIIAFWAKGAAVAWGYLLLMKVLWPVLFATTAPG